MMKDRKGIIISMLGICSLVLSACYHPKNAYDNYEWKEQGNSELTPVSDIYVEDTYESKPAITEPTLETYSSEDGLCVIEKKEDYYDVTLDYEKGTYEEVGTAYGNVTRQIMTENASFLEGYIYENIAMAFPELEGDYEPVEERMKDLKANLNKDYREEMEAYAKALSQGETGFLINGKLSYEECTLMHMIPDALRGTSCFSYSVWGEKTTDHNRYSSRVLEWTTGSERQIMCLHSVVHVKNNDKSYTAIGILGLLDILTAVNDNGVMIGELDVGVEDSNYTSKGKSCYTYALRYALENYDNANDVSNYLIEHANEYTFNSNVLVNDKNHSYCVELCNNPEYGEAKIRDNKTPMKEEYEWDNKDSICIINDYVLIGNKEKYYAETFNTIRMAKLNRWLLEKDTITFAEFKDLLTRDNIEDGEVEGMRGSDANMASIYNDYMVHIAVVNYGTNEIEVAFGSADRAKNKPNFIRVGKCW